MYALALGLGLLIWAPTQGPEANIHRNINIIPTLSSGRHLRQKYGYHCSIPLPRRLLWIQSRNRAIGIRAEM